MELNSATTAAYLLSQTVREFQFSDSDLFYDLVAIVYSDQDLSALSTKIKSSVSETGYLDESNFDVELSQILSGLVSARQVDE